MASDRPTKLAKLQSLRKRLPHISQSALAQLLRVAAQEELPACGGRSDVRAARDSLGSLVTPYGAVHQRARVHTTSDTMLDIEVQHPLAMLYHSCSTSPSLSGLLKQAIAAKAPTRTSPWRLVLYLDEIGPGNQLAYRNFRRMYGFYWTLWEFGSAALADEAQPHESNFDHVVSDL